jgi:glutamate-1-semialdehyde 2,1-aminomutase
MELSQSSPRTAGIDRERLAELTATELELYRKRGPRSAERYERAQESLLSGVPMSWMLKWAGAFPIVSESGAFPIFGARAHGSRLVDVDGNEYVDFCLGDTGAMTGHSPQPLVDGLAAEIEDGLTYMLPTDWVIEAAEQLRKRFGLPKWQFTVSATDANRFSIRLSRALTGRPKILVFNYCYHGSVDEALASRDSTGAVVARAWNLGPPGLLAETTRVVEFNDLDAVERELTEGDVACVLAEPALTNVGIVLPEEGFHDGLRELTREHGALLILDETHTICAGPGGFTGELGLEPDILTIGKAVGGGVPAGAWGVSEVVAERIFGDANLGQALVEGIGVGGTLAGNVLSARAIALTLANLLTEDDFVHMRGLAHRWKEGVERHVAALNLPWHVTQLGARAEYHFCASRPRNGSQLAAVGDEKLERYLRLYLTNRGILTTPFHNMALMAPSTSEQDVDRHDEVLGEALRLLCHGD